MLCSFFITLSAAKAEIKFIDLGNIKSINCWVYLSGLAESFDSDQEQEHRQILDNIGKELNIRFIALKPRNICPKFNNKICWPHKDPQQAIETYTSLLPDLAGIDIKGWIGFSNGGYFLQEILQQKLLTVPIIIIGAAGQLDSLDNVYIMIGKEDTYAYERAKNLKYKIIEYKGGHAINGEALREVLQSLIDPPRPS